MSDRALHLACAGAANKAGIQELIDSGYDINSFADLVTENSDSDVLQQGRGNVSTGAPLHFAAARKSEPIVSLLLDNGADVNTKDGEGKTALHHAALNNAGAVMRTLIQRGAEIEAQDDHGNTPLHSAASKSDKLPVEILAKQNYASLTATNKHGNTPLHVAAQCCSKNAAAVLLSAAEARKDLSCLSVRNDAGLTPLQTAQQTAHDIATVELLLKWEKKRAALAAAAGDGGGGGGSIGDTPVTPVAAAGLHPTAAALQIETPAAPAKQLAVAVAVADASQQGRSLAPGAAAAAPGCVAVHDHGCSADSGKGAKCNIEQQQQQQQSEVSEDQGFSTEDGEMNADMKPAIAAGSDSQPPGKPTKKSKKRKHEMKIAPSAGEALAVLSTKKLLKPSAQCVQQQQQTDNMQRRLLIVPAAVVEAPAMVDAAADATGVLLGQFTLQLAGSTIAGSVRTSIDLYDPTVEQIQTAALQLYNSMRPLQQPY